MTQLPEGRQPLAWKDMPFPDRPNGHPSTERLEIEKLKERVEELVTENRCLRSKNQELTEAVAMADWHFRGANMNMKALEKKITDALWCFGGEKDDG